MHGVPESLNLSPLIGLKVTQICLGSHQIQIRFHPEGAISIEGPLELYSPDGELIESGDPSSLSKMSHLGSLLETKIEAANPRPPSVVEVRFDSGHLLRLIDDSN